MLKKLAPLLVTLGILALPGAASALNFEPASGSPLTGSACTPPDPCGMPENYVPIDVASGDFNGDGNDDLAVVGEFSRDIFVYLSDGDGTFTPSEANPIGTNSTATGRDLIRATDVNGDGDLDLVTKTSGIPTIEIFRNRTDLHPDREWFDTVPTATVSLNTFPALAGFRSVALGDKDGDGDEDMAIGLYENSYVYLRNDGDGSYSAPNGAVAVSRPDPEDGDSFGSLAIGDYDGDGKGDLALTSNGVYSEPFRPDQLILLKGTDATSFSSSPVLLSEGGEYEYLGSLVSTDLNGDAFSDLAFTEKHNDPESPTFGGYLKTATGGPGGLTLNSGSTGTVSAYGPSQIAAADFDGDTNNDFAIPRFVDENFEIALGDGAGNIALDPFGPFGFPQINAKKFAPQTAVSLDVDGDGDLDLASVSGRSGGDAQALATARGVAVMLNQPSPGISVTPASLDFGEVPVDAELIAPETVTIHSTGGSPVNLLALDFTGPDSLAFQALPGTCLGGPLAPGASCTVDVNMWQTQVGDFSASLAITNDATVDPLEVPITGSVVETVDPPDGKPKISLSVKSAKKVKAGKKLLVTATIRNTGDADSGPIVLKASAPAKVARKVPPIRIKILPHGKNAVRKFRIPIKKNAKGKFKVKVILTGDDPLSTQTGTVRVIKKKQKRR